ncbi:MAG: cytochrome c-type biogenesis protein CcmH [Zoogloeaceae bacterium]|jgi:cytochrome c-type biogenesis protein CcmH|nr:cytochrome c-type biogenesis protein CcmH [Zoogloeaceae bacterium]
MSRSLTTKAGRGGLRLIALSWLAALCVAAAAPGFAKEAAPLAEDEAVEQRMVAISEELRCLVCQNESLAGSRAELAYDLRREIREKISQGKSDKEILDFMVDRYGDFVRYRPPLKSTTLLLWFGPFLLLAAGVTGLLFYLRRRGKRVVAANLSAEEQKQAEALLKLGEGANGS